MKTLALAFFLCASVAVAAQQKPAKSAYSCIAAADEKCPDPSDYSRIKAFLEKYKAPRNAH
jgi:hypothetical protein